MPIAHPTRAASGFSTIHRPYYYDYEVFSPVVLRRAQ
jgi:hypothetical protein